MIKKLLLVAGLLFAGMAHTQVTPFQPANTVMGCGASACAPSGRPAPVYIASGAGIDATGVADSTTALQAILTAVNLAGASGTPGVMHVPAGTYKTTACLNTGAVPGGLTIEGEGMATVFRPTGSFLCLNGSTNSETNPARTSQEIYLRNFGVKGDNATTATGLIYITNSFAIGLDNIDVFCVPSTVGSGIRIAQSGGVQLNNVRVVGAGGSCTGANVGSTDGIRVLQGSDVLVTNGDVEGFEGTGQAAFSTSGSNVALTVIKAHGEANYYHLRDAAAGSGYITASQDNCTPSCGSGSAGNTLNVTLVNSANPNLLGIGSCINSFAGAPCITALGTGTGGTGTYTLSGSAQTIASTANSSVYSNGQVTFIGGQWYGPNNSAPEAFYIGSDNATFQDFVLANGGTAPYFHVVTGGFKNINIGMQPNQTGGYFTSTSDLSGVHFTGALSTSPTSAFSNALLRNGSNHIPFLFNSQTSGASFNMFALSGFAQGAVRVLVTVSTTSAINTFQLDFSITAASTFSPIIVTQLGNVVGARNPLATFALAAIGGTGVELSMTPTVSSGNIYVTGFLDYYGMDSGVTTQSVVQQ